MAMQESAQVAFIFHRSSDAALARMRHEQWDEVITTNLGSMFNATQPLVLQLAKQRSDVIINMTSYAGVQGAASRPITQLRRR